jgi:hypothetical protein
MKIPITEIWEFLGLKLKIDATKETINLNLGPLTIEDFSYETFKLLKSNDEKRIEIITTIFIDRRIMWQSYERETIQECMESLQSLIDYCNEEFKDLTKSKRDDNKFYGKLLKQIATYSIRAKREFEDVEKKIVFLNSTARDNEEMTEDSEWIPNILKTFRVDCLPIVKMFIDLLDKNDPQLSIANKSYNQATKLLIEHHKLEPSQILEPYWEFKSKI